MHAQITNEGTYAPLDLFAGEFPRVTRSVTLAAGSGTLAAGSVLGRVTSSGEYVLSDASATNGSEDPVVILAHDVTLGTSQVEAIVYLTGEFRSEALTFGAGHTAGSTRAPLRALSIFI